MVGAGIGTETLCIIVIIIRSLQERQLLAPSGPSAGLWNSEQNDKLTMLELSSGFILPAFDITVPAQTISLKRPRFCLKWVLNSIDNILVLILYYPWYTAYAT